MLQFPFLHRPLLVLTVCICVEILSMMKHSVLPQHDTWIPFERRSCLILPQQRSDGFIFGDFHLSHHYISGTSAFVSDSPTTNLVFHIYYNGAPSISLTQNLQLVGVNFVRCIGVAALTGPYVVDMLLHNQLLLPENISSPPAINVYHWSS